jgi:hypothetical protein
VVNIEFVVTIAHINIKNESKKREVRNLTIEKSQTNQKPNEILKNILLTYDEEEKSKISTKNILKKIIRCERMIKEEKIIKCDFIPEICRRSVLNEKFLQYKNVNNSILVFFNEKLIGFLKNQNILYVMELLDLSHTNSINF